MRRERRGSVVKSEKSKESCYKLRTAFSISFRLLVMVNCSQYQFFFQCKLEFFLWLWGLMFESCSACPWDYWRQGPEMVHSSQEALPSYGTGKGPSFFLRIFPLDVSLSWSALQFFASCNFLHDFCCVCRGIFAWLIFEFEIHYQFGLNCVSYFWKSVWNMENVFVYCSIYSKHY